MILDKEDFNKFPKAIIDLNTSNESFLKIHEFLKNIGVENNSFHLTLLNPMLKDVEYNLDNLNPHYKSLVLDECYQNPWFYFREIVKIDLTTSELLMLWGYFKHGDIVLPTSNNVVPNSILELINGLNTIWNNNSVSIVLSPNVLLKTKMCNSLMSIPTPNNIKSEQKGDSIYYYIMNNRISFLLGDTSKVYASNIGRGISANSLFILDYQDVPNVEITLESLLPAMGACNCERDGYYGMIATIDENVEIDGTYDPLTIIHLDSPTYLEDKCFVKIMG